MAPDAAVDATDASGDILAWKVGALADAAAGDGGEWHGRAQHQIGADLHSLHILSLQLSPLVAAAVISVTPKQTHTATHISLLPLLFPFSAAAAVVDTHSQQSTDPDQVV